MGYNPLRRYRGGRFADLAILIGTALVIVALVVWASR
jgi:hypothetical protein